MKNNWAQIEKLFHETLDLKAEERHAFLDRVCAGDEALRKELESLISAFEGRSDFLQESPFSSGLKILAETAVEGALAGKQIGSYKILRLLGKGGTGEVYLAEDTLLDRKVALKFLSNTFVDDGWARRQLIREAQAVAKLDPSNICAVYGFEEADGHCFMVMQYVEGDTLACIINNKPLETDRAVALALQIAGALSEAHSHYIIHRDIKPQNVIATASGQVKVLDFGLAKLIQQKQNPLNGNNNQSHLSQNGLVAGTIAYMSPEQLRAERLDFRSDIFSFGIVFYEMLSGQNPFINKSQAETISAILNYNPSPVNSVISDIPDYLSQIVQKCLNKDKEQRYNSTLELLIELNNFKDGASLSTPLRRFSGIHSYVLFVFLALIITAITLLFYSATNKKIPTFAVLPIANASNNVDNDYLSDGLTESLINKLSHLANLRVKASTLVSRYKGQTIDSEIAGRELNADAVLTGKIVKRGEDTLAMEATLVNTADGTQIWSNVYKIEGTDLITSQEEIATQITSKLQVALSNDEKQFLAKKQTADPRAYEQYFRGRYYWNTRSRSNIEKAIESFNKAIDIDPYYAQAWAGLADSYVLQSLPSYGSLKTKDAMANAKAAALKALEIDETLSDAHTSLGIVKLRYEWDWQGAEEDFLKAINSNSNYAPAHFWYSNLLIIRKQFDKALVEAEKAKALDPLYPNYQINLGRILYYDRQSDKAIQIFAEALKNNSANKNAAYLLGLTYMQKGMFNEAIDVFEKFYGNSDEDKIYFAPQIGYAYGKTGRKSDALKVLADLERFSKQNHIPPQEQAIIYLGINDKNKAFEHFNLSCKERYPAFPFILMEHFFDELRMDPRFAALESCISPLPVG